MPSSFCHFPVLIYVEFFVEQYTHMETIQVVLDEKLLKAADIAAKRQKVSRSALIRRAVLEHLRRLREVELEKQDLRGYTAQPQLGDEYAAWERLAEWPKD